MQPCDTLIRNVKILDGGGGDPQPGDVAISSGRIAAVGTALEYAAQRTVDGAGHMLAPGFIDAHTHDDLYLIRKPEMLPKLSQGVTTVIVGNCGISGGPTQLTRGFPDPANLLGTAAEFRYPTFKEYVDAVGAVRPAVNVAAFVGHTTLRNNHMDRLDRVATAAEIDAMRAELHEALEHGALGLSTGLAYLSAHSASEAEVIALAVLLSQSGGMYATHLRSERECIVDAIEEALRVGRHGPVPVVISHLKCAGVDNWQRSGEILDTLQQASPNQTVGWDCYPYAASSSTLDLLQVDDRVPLTITWSNPHPELAGQPLSQIATTWGLSQVDSARRLQPAGAIYHCMCEDDVRRILQHPATMIGSDGLPNDPFPHPRLWGTFPRVLGHYSRSEKLFSLAEAVRKMTSLPAQRFGLSDRGWIRKGYVADLVLFDAEAVRDMATFADPTRPAMGIRGVWVDGMLSYTEQGATEHRAGRFLPSQPRPATDASTQ